jgi:hypothetical protein
MEGVGPDVELVVIAAAVVCDAGGADWITSVRNGRQPIKATAVTHSKLAAPPTPATEQAGAPTRPVRLRRSVERSQPPATANHEPNRLGSTLRRIVWRSTSTAAQSTGDDAQGLVALSGGAISFGESYWRIVEGEGRKGFRGFEGGRAGEA